MDILYLKENTIYDSKGNSYSVTDIQSLKKLKTRRFTILADVENTKETIITVPSSLKSKPKQAMKHEAFKLSGEESMEKFERKYMYRWRHIGTSGGNTMYLLFVVPRSEIAPQLILLKKKFHIKDVFCVNDVFAKYCQDINKEESTHVVFIGEEHVYYAAIEKGMYKFGRRFNVTDTSQTGGIDWEEEFILELKRSIFHAKQRYKFSSSEIKIINHASKKHHSDYTPALLELGIEKVHPSVVDSITGIPIYDLFMSAYPSILPLCSFLLDEFIREKTVEKVSQILSILLVIPFLLVSMRVFRAYSNYTTSVERYDHTSIEWVRVELKKVAYRREIETLQKLRLEYDETRKIASKRLFLEYYLKVLQYVIPTDSHIETAKIYPNGNNTYTAELTLQVDSNNLKERVRSMQEIERNLRNSPLLSGNIRINSNSLLKNGRFQLWAVIKKIVQENQT